jgi:hypothetical protein
MNEKVPLRPGSLIISTQLKKPSALLPVESRAESTFCPPRPPIILYITAQLDYNLGAFLGGIEGVFKSGLLGRKTDLPSASTVYNDKDL